jgi:hypothetical protein
LEGRVDGERERGEGRGERGEIGVDLLSSKSGDKCSLGV